MHLHRQRRLVTPLVLLLFAAVAFAQSAQQNAADAEWLIKSLEIHEGSAVGEIGAGDGELTVAMAKAVGPTGTVFSNELNKERLAALPRAAEKAGVKNVTPVEGRETETGFSDQCCDAIFMPGREQPGCRECLRARGELPRKRGGSLVGSGQRRSLPGPAVPPPDIRARAAAAAAALDQAH